MKYVYTLTASYWDPYNKNAMFPYTTLVGIFKTRKKAEKAQEEDNKEFGDEYSIDKVEIL
tara:strand:+ start:780 stop:959 length:180 start_codon:yes stop_codon:yes gene_type:complete